MNDRGGMAEDKLTSEEAAFRSELAAANINPDSFLATDYLNHFNEIVMLLEMAVDMPDLMEEAAEWKPASYVEHFQGSGFVARDLVIKAWNMAPPGTRTRFEDVVRQLDTLVLSVLDALKNADVTDGIFDDQTRTFANVAQGQMQEHLSDLNAIIHIKSSGSGPELSGTTEAPGSEACDESSFDAQSQEEIDQLFG